MGKDARDASARAALAPGAVLLGTVALEPNRWGVLSQDRRPHLRVADWIGVAEEAGFDGVELWENHATLASDEDLVRLQSSSLPLAVFSSYASFEEEGDASRDAVAAWVGRLGCAAVKFNIGNDAAHLDAYIERLDRFAARLPAEVRLICECHAGTVAEDPATAARVLSAVGDAERLQALVHLGDEPAHTGAMFDALGDRIRHVHVNFLRQGAPPLVDIADDVHARIERLRKHGFSGSHAIEFVNGVGSERDQPAQLIEAAVRDLAALRSALRG